MDNCKKNKFERLSNWLVGHIITVIILFCLVSFGIVCFIYLFKYPDHLRFFELLYFIPVIILFLIEILIILKSIHIKHYLVLWSVIFILKSIIIILCLNSPPQGDGGGIFNEALYLSQGGDFALDSSNYYYNCYWLMWTVYVEKIIIDVLGVGYGFFKTIGMLCLLGSGLIIYNIANRLFNERLAKIVFGIYVVFVPISLCVSQFSHQHLAFFLLLLSIYLMISEVWYKWALAGLTCGIMNGFRPWGILLLLTACIYFIYCIFKKKNKFLYRFLLLIIFFIVYKLTGMCINQILIISGYYDPQVLNDSMIWIKIDRGIDPEMNSFGKYAEKYAVSHAGTNAELISIRNELYKKHVIELLKSAAPYTYIANKMVRMFGEVDYWFENCFANKLSILQYPNRILYFFNWFQYIIVVIFAFVGKLRDKNDKVVNMLSIFTIGYFFAHIFIEAFSSYRLCIYPCLLMYAALGIDKMYIKYSSCFTAFTDYLHHNIHNRTSRLKH